MRDGYNDVLNRMSHLEFIFQDHALYHILFHFPQYGSHSNIRFASPSWGTDEEIFICIVSCLEHYRLNTVQLFHSFETNLSNLRMREHSCHL